MAANKGRLMQDAKTAMGGLVGTSVEMKGRRKSRQIEIDADSVKHIAYDISEGRVSIPRAALSNLPQYLRNAEYVGRSEVDRSGKHAKVNRRNLDFEYYKMTIGGKEVFANVLQRRARVGGRMKTRYRLHNITNKIKNLNER